MSLPEGNYAPPVGWESVVGYIVFSVHTDSARDRGMIERAGLHITNGGANGTTARGVRFTPFALAHITASPGFTAIWDPTKPGNVGPAVAVFVRQGSLEIVESAELRPRTYVRNDFALVIPGHSPVTFVCGEATELLWFAFEPETTFTPEMLDSTVLHLADDSPVLKGVRAALLEIIYSPETSHPHMATSMRSFSRAIGRAITNEAFVPKSGDLLEAARAVVAQRATEIGFDTQRLARALGVSRRTLERAGAASQWNPSREIRNIRAQHAYSTINQHPHLSLRDVAASSGFGSIDSMRRTIRTIYGVSPAEARGVDPTSEDSGTTT